MLRLTQQIRRHPGGIAAAVGHHQDLAGSGDHVDIHLTEHLSLGRGPQTLPGPTILSTGDALRAVGQRRHRPCPPSLKIRSTPTLAAARISGWMEPSGRGGVTMMISGTPASLAGTTSMRTVLG